MENVGGAGGNTGVAQAARSAGDGYTVVVVSTGFVVNPSLYEKIPYDPKKDFAPITNFANTANVVSINPKFPANNVKEFEEQRNSEDIQTISQKSIRNVATEEPSRNFFLCL